MQSENNTTLSFTRREWFSRAAATAVAASFGYPLLASVAPSNAHRAASVSDPPNAAAQHIWDPVKGSIRLTYNGVVIFEATVAIKDAAGIRPLATNEVAFRTDETRGDKVEQNLRFDLSKVQPGAELVLRGTVNASHEAFPADCSKLLP